MHPADIKAALNKAGHTNTSLARQMKVSPGAVWLVVRGGMTSARIAQHISSATGLPVGQLWPGRYPQLEQRAKSTRTTRRAVAAARA